MLFEYILLLYYITIIVITIIITIIIIYQYNIIIYQYIYIPKSPKAVLFESLGKVPQKGIIAEKP